ncbi:hypothetical protein FI667_g6549, partial [Globisporangium splendens]
MVIFRWKRGNDRKRLNQETLIDLEWLKHILDHDHSAELPLQLFGSLPEADWHLYMDASNVGLAVLNPSCDEYVQIKYDKPELKMVKEATSGNADFAINIREHLCVALAVWTWVLTWIDKHKTKVIQCWSDDASAVAWTNCLHSRNKLAQEINRAIGLGEALFNVRMAASHLSGATNRMADAASRTWNEPFSSTWANVSVAWTQVTVPRFGDDFTRTSRRTSSPLFVPVLIQQVQNYMATMAVLVHRSAASSMAAAFKVPALTPACLLCRSAKTKLLQVTDMGAAIKRAAKVRGHNKDELERCTHLDEKTTSSMARKMASTVTNSVAVALSINATVMLYGSNPPSTLKSAFFDRNCNGSRLILQQRQA